MSALRARLRTSFALVLLTALALSGAAQAQRVEALAPQVRKYLRVNTPKVVLEHVDIIDGTGAAPRRDQNLAIADGKIASISKRPIADITEMERVRFVMKDGRVVRNDLALH